ncbi:maltokinase N-terminal cap-like domain-containing protein [Methylacidimicrobium tartarophylax]|uniref:Maltokinase n=1 Tax=Methylacidimicrobium tartarophylax TaxID=1041768 RepID=A0A5E6MH43_9BACT|nr:phosphotransferase [Methylacidimicrobium tartarophylax]VVM07206.1 maltokinase [Methylacidimicrobium tartarophylax]
MRSDSDPLAERFWFSAEGRRLAGTLFPPFLLGRRWFSGKARGLEEVWVADAFLLGPREAGLRLLLLQVRFAAGETALFSLPIRLAGNLPPTGLVEGDRIGPLSASSPQCLWEATGDPLFGGALLDLLAEEKELLGPQGILRGRRGPLLDELDASGELPKDSRLLGREQSNSSLLFGNHLFFKLYRKIEGGPNPDAEIHERLSGVLRFPHVPRYGGRLDYEPQNGPPILLGLLTEAVPHRSDAWTLALAAATEWMQQAGEHRPEEPSSRPSWELLGRRTAEFHLAMAGPPDDPAFRPEPLRGEEIPLFFEGALGLLRRSFGMPDGPPEVPLGVEEERLAKLFPRIEARFRAILRLPANLLKIRIHGDYHLGQVLATEDDFVLIDFEGEPERSLAERRHKTLALRDVAGMVRSFHYAALAPIFLQGDTGEERSRRLAVADDWRRRETRRFLEGYFAAAGGAPFLPTAPAERGTLLDFFVLEKAVYEVGYERNNRPAWMQIPLRGIEELLEGSRQSEENGQS